MTKTNITPTLDEHCANALRVLSMDGVQAANSGHPGMPMGMAPTAYWLWTKHLKLNPNNPNWADRDRFVLSAGHGSMLLYSLLYLTGYGLEINDLKHFRQWGSLTPGHPEYGHTQGVELTTGPLGQGISTAVGLAMAEAHLAKKFNTDDHNIVDHTTWVIVGDGCLQEGISSEASSLAGHLGLGKLICIYDDNQITIDGDTSLSFTEDVTLRYEAYGWQVINVEGDGNDFAAIDHAFLAAKAETTKPTLIRMKTKIGFGSPNKAGSHAVHGSPLGDSEIELTKKALGYPSMEPFFVADDVLALYREVSAVGSKHESKWQELFARYKSQYPELAQKFEQQQRGTLPISIDDYLPTFEKGKAIATRSASGEVLNAIMPKLDNILGGSADLTPSNNTWFDGAVDFQKDNYAGRYVRYGVREHAMGAILNGLNVHGGLRAYGGTFMVFADYLRPALRVAALSKYPSIFVLTHDSIGVGEDGPTHQPVETLASLRAIIGLNVFRPADANETAQVWKFVLENPTAPAAILLSRQGLINRDEQGAHKNTDKGAYVVVPQENPDVLLIASGSEVTLAIEAASELATEGVKAQVISMPCMELFTVQSEHYKQSVIPSSCKARVVVEAGIEQGWGRIIGDAGEFIGMSTYGASAPGNICFEKFGLTQSAVANAARQSLAKIRG
ncbi:transketolase [Reinekea sp.]|uniref:transketolase n=1 Tax=Reinekea sp. TaxID=1970455 RepID=UPI003988BF14